MEDQIAIQRLKNDDPSGLEFLVDKYQLMATQAAWLIVRDRQTAEDIASQAFLKAYQRIRQFKNTGNFQSWFYRIVVNLALDHLRAQKRFVDHEPEQIETDDRFMDDELSVEEQIEKAQTIDELRNAFLKLSPEHRAVLVSRYFLGLSEKETAQQLGKPVSTVKSRRFSAIQQLRLALTDDFYSFDRKEKKI